ncbi:MAG TPA: helix-hairpin-helix domain-containing protein [Polyangiales bacterium]|nr:helix-hairpin-helix domain-containing protein [Polyangiales bacterium]
MTTTIENAQIAEKLERCAELLEAQGADAHRVRAYRTAAQTVRTHPSSVAQLAKDGCDALDALYGVGKSIAAAIEQLVRTGRWAMLDRLQGEVSAEQLLRTLPGIGATLAQRVHAQLGVETLEDLERAAHDGSLAHVRGFGRRRVKMVRAELASLLAHAPRAAATPPSAPSVRALLEIDARYRDQAARERLPRIAPRRFNPSGEAWLPILHTEAEGFHVHALFSNTALAHKLHRSRDWVVLYFDRDGETGQHTVVSESHGPLAGRRVVRGRESECAVYYAQLAAASDTAPAGPRELPA